MAKISYGGSEHSIPPFKLREIRAAAPYIDRVLAQRRSLAVYSGESSEEAASRMVEEESNVISNMTGALSDTISVIAVGVLRGRGEYPYTPAKIAAVADEIEGELSMGELSSLSVIFNDILFEAGMMKARPTMPGAGTSTSPSASESTESSLSSSQPDAPVATGSE